jgi:hypothetical protein
MATKWRMRPLAQGTLFVPHDEQDRVLFANSEVKASPYGHDLLIGGCGTGTARPAPLFA